MICDEIKGITTEQLATLEDYVEGWMASKIFCASRGHTYKPPIPRDYLFDCFEQLFASINCTVAKRPHPDEPNFLSPWSFCAHGARGQSNRTTWRDDRCCWGRWRRDSNWSHNPTLEPEPWPDGASEAPWSIASWLLFPFGKPPHNLKSSTRQALRHITTTLRSMRHSWPRRLSTWSQLAFTVLF